MIFTLKPLVLSSFIFLIAVSGHAQFDCLVSEQDSNVYTLVDQMPVYRNDSIFADYGGNGFVFRSDRIEKGSAIIYIGFDVDKTGTLDNFKVLTGNNLIDSETIRDKMVKMGDWLPGTCNGTAVRVRMHLPVQVKPGFSPDTAIGPISLNNTEHIDRYLGKDVMDRLVDNTFPFVSVVSSDSKQRLTCYLYPGGATNAFAEFQVGYVDRKRDGERTLQDKTFETESGIKLGITMEDLRSIKGEPDSLTNNGTTLFHYTINDFENAGFLKRYNMPTYYANYKFENNHLVEFRFGFAYP